MGSTPIETVPILAVPRIDHPILIVEDQEDARETLADLLDLLGYKVRCASNGQEALEVIERDPLPCLILLDLNMPVMDGWEFRRRQLQKQELARIPVALMSAIATPETAEELQAVVLLGKPLDPEYLIQIIKENCTSSGG